jgi:hypothetical protein
MVQKDKYSVPGKKHDGPLYPHGWIKLWRHPLNHMPARVAVVRKNQKKPFYFVPFFSGPVNKGRPSFFVSVSGGRMTKPHT